MKEKKEKIVAIALDGVLRNITSTFEKIYLKYYPQRPIKKPINMFNILDSFTFNIREEKEVGVELGEYAQSYQVDELKDFIQAEAPIIWGRADELRRSSIEDLNNILPVLKEKGYKVVLISKESQKTKPGTLFWLGDRGTEVNEVRFVDNNEDFWENVDILVTSNPEVINLKPKNKKAIVFNSQLNKDVRYARRIRSIKELITKI